MVRATDLSLAETPSALLVGEPVDLEDRSASITCGAERPEEVRIVVRA